jgi:uncharacterized membrane protein HdeD (DUF308 family)
MIAMATPMMLQAIAKNCWLIVLRGVCAMLFGVLTFVWSSVTLVTLALLYVAFALAQGVMALGAAIFGSTTAPRW